MSAMSVQRSGYSPKTKQMYTYEAWVYEWKRPCGHIVRTVTDWPTREAAEHAEAWGRENTLCDMCPDARGYVASFRPKVGRFEQDANEDYSPIS